MFRNRFIRIFVSSTFEDMEIERNILQRIVFPKLTRYCNSRGWEFEDIDLRWGINDEASLDQRTMQICLEELRECQKTSPRPNFLILQGDRYGWIPLPEILTKEQGDHIRDAARPEEKDLFERWYKLDTNHGKNSGGVWSLQARHDEFVTWSCYRDQVETPLRQLFKRAGEDWMNESATEQEIWAGALSLPDSDDHVVLYDRHLKAVPGKEKPKFIDKEGALLWGGSRRVRTLRSREYSKIRHILKRDLNYSELVGLPYERWFSANIETVLLQVIDQEIDHYVSIPEERIIEDRERDFISRSAASLVGHKLEVDAITRNSGWGHIMHLSGPEGSGLSTISAAGAARVPSVFCSPGITHMGANGDDILRTLWNRLGGGSSGETFSHRNLRKLFSSYSGDYLTVIVDGLYHLDKEDDIFKVSWYGPSVSKKLKLVLTGDFSDLLNNPMEAPTVLTVDEFTPEEAGVYLTDALDKLDINLAESQKSFVCQLLESGRYQLYPRYLNLLLEDLAQWHSYDTVPVLRYSESLDEYIRQMTRKYGKKLFELALRLMRDSKYGASTHELRGFLMRDESFRAEFEESSHHKLEGSIAPAVLCTRLLKDLAPFIRQASLFDTYLNRISTPSFNEVIEKTLPPDNAALFDFYNSRWRKNTHALHEVGFLAGRLDEHSAVKGLFGNLDYAVSKLEKGDSLRLRTQMSAMLGTSPELLDFVLFDADAEAYCRSHPELSPGDAVYRLAAAWKPESSVREAFDRAAPYASMNNTIGWRRFADNMFLPVPGEPDKTALPDQDGRVLWLQDGFLMSASPFTGVVERLEDRSYTTFKIVAPGECVLYDNHDFSLLTDGYKTLVHSFHLIGPDISWRYYRTVIDNFVSWKDRSGGYHIAYIANSLLAWILIRPSQEKGRYDSEEAILPLESLWKWKVCGFLYDGKSIILQSLVYKDGKHTKVQVMKVDRDGKHLSFDLDGSVVSSSDCQHDDYSPYVGMFPALTTNGHDKLATVFFRKSEKGRLYFLTLVTDYSKAENRHRYLDLSACSLSRGWTYYLHLDTAGKTLLHCSLDTRLVVYNLSEDKVADVLHLPSEGIEPHADPENRYLLFDSGEYRRMSKSKVSLFNRLIDLGKKLTADDYFESGLTNISADKKASFILTSFGTFYAICAESAMAYQVEKEKVIRKSMPKDGTWSFSTAVAVSDDASRFSYALGGGDYYDVTGFIPYVICDESGRKIDSDGTVTMMRYSLDGHSLWALVSHTRSHEHRMLRICDGKADKWALSAPTQAFEQFKSFKESPNCRYVLYCSGMQFQGGTLGILDIVRNETRIIAQNVKNYWWFPDSRSFCYTGNGFTCVYPLNGEDPIVVNKEALAISPTGGIPLYRHEECGLEQRRRIVRLDDKIEFAEYCPDGRHLFVICDVVVYLIDWPAHKVVQRFYLAYPDDLEKRDFSKQWVAGEWAGSKRKATRDPNHCAVYDKGLLISDWDTLFRLEPSGGYCINQEVYTTLKVEGNAFSYRCPVCGHVHRVDRPAVESILNQCSRNLSLLIDEEKWDAPQLSGYQCEQCGVKLRFNPFYID